MHSELSYGLSFAPKLQRVAVIDLSGSHQPTPDPSFSRRLIALRMDGDSPALRKIRPIAIGSVLGRVVSKCAAAGSTVRFATLFQPPTQGSCPSRPRTQTDGSPWPVQVGICCRNGTEIAHHAVSALLDSNPTHIDVALDVKNAFNLISRESFMPLVQSHLPDLHTWIQSMYGGTTHLFYGDPTLPDLPPTKILSQRGTRQGCPLGAQLFSLGLHPLLCALARLIGHGGAVISYADDIHLVGPPSTIALALKSLLQPSPPLDASLSLDCRLSSIGLNLSAGKSSILCGLDVNPNTLSSTLGSNLLASLGASISHISSSGHIVLGSPIGSQEYAASFAEHKIDEARRVLKLITDLLLDRDSSGASNTGVFSPDEHNILMRYTIRSKVSHLLLLRTLPPDTASQHFDKLHSQLLDAHLNVRPQFHSVSPESDQPFTLSSPHLDVRKVCSLPLALGGHGLLPFNLNPSPPQHSNPPINHSQSDLALTYHHSAFFSSWSATWSLIRAWVPPLRGESFPSASDLAPNAPPLPPYKRQVLRTWLLINAASAKLQHHPHRSVLPSHFKLPSFFRPLLDGENGPSSESPIPFQPTSNSPTSLSHSHRLVPPCLLDRQSPPHTQKAVSSLVSALSFLDAFQSASDTGKARLLDGSTQHGPATWLVRIPKVERFRYFEQGTDPISARAADLLACPPHLLGKNCLSCSFQPGLDRVPLGTDGRHFVHCRKGLRLHGAVSDKVRDELCYILERCGVRVVAERPSSHRQMSSFRQREGACLLKTPDLVLQDFHAPRSFTLIDIKIVDPSAASYVSATAKSALHRHRALEAAGPRDYFGPSRRPPPGARMRVVTFVCSTFGSLGAQAQDLIKDIGRRTNLFVPFSLTHETSWATSSITTFLRSALTFQVRKRVAVILREHLPDDFLG